jgi:inositol phosphorylceramide mannosyltransferase catalytic subunit
MTIPKIIHQTVRDKKNISDQFSKNISRLASTNEGWEHRIYDNRDIYDFISTHYDAEILNAYCLVNTRYGPAQADFFRYLLLFKFGGVYLDIKSTALTKLDEVISPDDEYILSHWPNAIGMPFQGFGIHPELPFPGEFQQWHIVAAPQHPFLERVIAEVTKNIREYDAARVGTGKRAVLRTTGPIAYTQAITPLRGGAKYRMVDIRDLGFVYSVLDPDNLNAGRSLHTKLFSDHYKQLTEPLIMHPGRNSLCFCGSEKKYKHCHGTLGAA